MNWKASLLLVLLSGASLAPAANAQKLAGELVLTKGVVQVRSRGRENLISITGTRVPLYEKDAVQTGPGSSATLKLRRRKTEIVRLYANSYLYLNAVEGTRTTIGLAAGKAEFSVSRPQPNLTRLEVKTRRLLIIAREAKFIVGVEAGASYVVALEGELTISPAQPRIGEPANHPLEQVAISTNQAILSDSETRFSPVVEISQGETKDIVSGEGLEAFRELEAPASREPISTEDGGN